MARQPYRTSATGPTNMILSLLGGGLSGYVGGLKEKKQAGLEREKFDWQKEMAESAKLFREEEASKTHFETLERLKILQDQVEKVLPEKERLEIANTFQTARDEENRQHQERMAEKGYTFAAEQGYMERASRFALKNMDIGMAKEQLMSREKLAIEGYDIAWARLDVEEASNLVIEGLQRDQLKLSEVVQAWREKQFTTQQTLDMFGVIMDVEKAKYSTKAQAYLMQMDATLKDGYVAGGLSSGDWKLINDFLLPLIVESFEDPDKYGKLAEFASKELGVRIPGFPKLKYDTKWRNEMLVEDAPLTPPEGQARETLDRENQILEQALGIRGKRDKLTAPSFDIFGLLQNTGKALGGGKIPPALQSLIESQMPPPEIQGPPPPPPPQAMPRGVSIGGVKLSPGAKDFVDFARSRGITSFNKKEEEDGRRTYGDEWEVIKRELSR